MLVSYCQKKKKKIRVNVRFFFLISYIIPSSKLVQSTRQSLDLAPYNILYSIIGI